MKPAPLVPDPNLRKVFEQTRTATSFKDYMNKWKNGPSKQAMVERMQCSLASRMMQRLGHDNADELIRRENLLREKNRKAAIDQAQAARQKRISQSAQPERESPVIKRREIK